MQDMTIHQIHLINNSRSWACRILIGHKQPVISSSSRSQQIPASNSCAQEEATATAEPSTSQQHSEAGRTNGPTRSVLL